jgi:hypothetical protein
MLLATGTTVTTAPAGRRQLDNEEDEEDARERARLQAEMRLLGIDIPVNRAGIATAVGESPNIWSADSSPAVGLPLSRSTSAAGPAPTPPPKDATSPALRATEQREREQRVELSSGRASGFTEIRGHRRRPSSQSSVGLGLSGVEQPLSRPTSSAGVTAGLTRANSMTAAPVADREAAGGWGKAFRRMSSSFGT